MRALPDLVDQHSALAARMAAFEGDLGPSGHSVPLRLAGGLHALALSGTLAPYPPKGDLAGPVRAALSDHEAHLLNWLARPPQTNEVGRAAVLIAVGHWLTARFGRRIVTSELGASAGLNLAWDFMRLDADGAVLGPAGSPVRLTPEWRGSPATICPPYVHEAVGVDLTPMDMNDPADRLRLMSYVWPDQPARLARTRAAIDLARRADTEGRLVTGDAVDWLRGRARPMPGALHLIYSTVAWQYLPAAARAEGQALIEGAGARATEEAPLAWFRMEADESGAPGAALDLWLWPSGERFRMGRVAFHGQWVDWDAPAS